MTERKKSRTTGKKKKELRREGGEVVRTVSVVPRQSETAQRETAPLIHPCHGMQNARAGKLLKKGKTENDATALSV